MSRVVTWEKQNLISIEPLSLAEIHTIFSLARYYKEGTESGQLKFDALEGRTVINLFLEPSTRTRLAFEIACKKLSADCISISGDASSLSKGESLKDTAQNIVALGADVIIMRHLWLHIVESLPRTGCCTADTVAEALAQLGFARRHVADHHHVDHETDSTSPQNSMTFTQNYSQWMMN